MRKCSPGFAMVLFMISFFSRGAAAQTKEPSQAPTATHSSPTPFDPHDLSGVWMQDRPRPGSVLQRYWIYELTLEEPHR
jgi:hypothetical protein